MSGKSGGEKLTVDRIYDEPDLAGVAFHDIAWRPGTRSLSYVKSYDTQREKKAELWGYDVKTQRGELLFDYARLGEPVPPQPHLLHPRVLPEVVPACYWMPGGDRVIVGLTLQSPRLLDLTTGTLEPLLGDELPIRQLKLSPDGRFVSVVSGYDLYLIDTTNRARFPITTGSSEQYRSASPDTMSELIQDGHWWSPDSSQVAYIQTDETAVPVFWYANLMSPRGENIPERFPQPGAPHPVMALRVAGPRGHVTIDASRWAGYLLAHVSWAPDSRTLALQFLNRTQNELCLVLADAATGATRRIHKETDSAWVNVCNDLRFFKDGRRFLWSSERESYRHLYLYDTDGNELAQLTSGPEASVGVLGLDEANEHVYYSFFPEPYTDGHVKRVSFQGETTQLTHDPGTHRVVLSPDFGYFADKHSTAVRPPHLDLYKTDGSRVATVEENPCEALAGFGLRPFDFRSIAASPEYPEAADMPMSSMLLEPRNMQPGKKYPVIVYVYGGPLPGGQGLARNVLNYWSPAAPGRALWAHMMAQEGFGFFSLDNRGSNAAARGHDWETPIHRRLGHVELADQLEGVRYLKSLDWVDPERIGILGGSFGGFMTLNGMLRAPAPGGVPTFKAGVSFAPVTDWAQYDSIYTERYMDLPAENVEGYSETRLRQYAQNLTEKSKLLLIHGALDPNVHVQHSVELIDALIMNDKKFRMMLYPRQVHGSFFGVGQRPARLWNRITDFFKEVL